MRRAARFAYLCFFGAMLLTGGLKRFALLGTHRSARALRLSPVYGQRDLGAGSRMKIGRMGAEEASSMGSFFFSLATICGPSNKTASNKSWLQKTQRKRTFAANSLPVLLFGSTRRVGSSPRYYSSRTVSSYGTIVDGMQ